MLKMDRVVLGTGVVIVVLAAIIAFASSDTGAPAEGATDGEGGPPAPSGTVTVDWRTTTEAVATIDGEKSGSESVGIPIQNLTTVTFTLSWTDDDLAAPNPINQDELTLSITGPGGGEYTFEPGSSVSAVASPIEIVAQINTVPTNTTLTAAELDAAASTAGTGEWTAGVTVEPNPPVIDDGNTWQLSVSATSYYAVPRSGGGGGQ